MFKKILLLLITGYLLSGVYMVAPDQQAVILRFGKVIAERVNPGIHYRLPYPIDQVYRLKVYETKRISIGLEMPDRVLGKAPETKTQFFTGDQNIINIHLMLQYVVQDPSAYLFRAAGVAQLIAWGTEASLSRVAASTPVDDLLTTGKLRMQKAVQADTQALLDYYGAGVLLTSVNVERMEPPEEVATAFREVASSRADRDRIISEAHSYANSTIPQARGQAYQVLQEAEGYKQRKVNEAKGDADRFAQLADEYRKAQEITSSRLYLEAMEEILPRIKKVIVDANGTTDAIDLTVVRGQE